MSPAHGFTPLNPTPNGQSRYGDVVLVNAVSQERIVLDFAIVSCCATSLHNARGFSVSNTVESKSQFYAAQFVPDFTFVPAVIDSHGLWSPQLEEFCAFAALQASLGLKNRSYNVRLTQLRNCFSSSSTVRNLECISSNNIIKTLITTPTVQN